MEPMSAVHHHRRIQHLRQECPCRRIVGWQGLRRMRIACDVDIHPEGRNGDNIRTLCSFMRPKHPLRHANGKIDIPARITCFLCRLRDVSMRCAGKHLRSFVRQRPKVCMSLRFLWIECLEKFYCVDDAHLLSTRSRFISAAGVRLPPWQSVPRRQLRPHCARMCASSPALCSCVHQAF